MHHKAVNLEAEPLIRAAMKYGWLWSDAVRAAGLDPALAGAPGAHR